MTPEQRNGFDNLLLLCPNHHRLIDRLEPDYHTAELLRSIKFSHERTIKDRLWTPSRDLEPQLERLLARYPLLSDGFPVDPTEGRFGDPYGLDRGPQYLTLTVPKARDNGSGSLYSSPIEGGLGIVIRVEEPFSIREVGHLLGVKGLVRTQIEIWDERRRVITSGGQEAEGLPGPAIYEGTWNWFDVALAFDFVAGTEYVIHFASWRIVEGSPLHPNNWNFLQPFLRDVEGRAYDKPFKVGRKLVVIDGTHHGSRITGIPPASLTLA